MAAKGPRAARQLLRNLSLRHKRRLEVMPAAAVTRAK